MPCWLTPFVPWQLAQAAARLRPRLGSVPCARAGTATAAPETSAAARTLRIMSASSMAFVFVFRVSFRPRGLSRGAPAKNKSRPRRLFVRCIGKGSRFRSHLGHFFFDELERDLVRFVDVHGDLPAVGELAE